RLLRGRGRELVDRGPRVLQVLDDGTIAADGRGQRGAGDGDGRRRLPRREALGGGVAAPPGDVAEEAGSDEREGGGEESAAVAEVPAPLEAPAGAFHLDGGEDVGDDAVGLGLELPRLVARETSRALAGESKEQQRRILGGGLFRARGAREQVRLQEAAVPRGDRVV